jgi:S-adenosylhomocysteine hydrolase
MLIVSAAGESVLDAAVLDQLPDGVFLAPFATRDFSVCQEDANLIAQSTAFMGIGRRFQLRNGNSFVLLGEGRSLNLFETDSIPNQGYDAYRAGTLIAARQLARVVDGLRPGIHNDFADEAVSAAGLFERYYELHLSICRGMGDGKAPETETE